MDFPKDIKYSKDHEWIRVEGNIAYIGITQFAQSELGDIVYVEVDTLGETLKKDEVFGTVEAVKTSSELYLPVSGKIIEFNPSLDENKGDNPALINEDPYNEGWIIKIEITNIEQIDELMDCDTYKNMVE